MLIHPKTKRKKKNAYPALFFVEPIENIIDKSENNDFM